MGISACSAIMHVERGRSPETSALRLRTSWTPPSHRPGLGPAPGLPGSARGAGSKVRHGRSSGGQGEAGTRPARAWQRVPGRLGGAGTRGVQGAPVARSWGRLPRQAARQGPGLRQPRGRRGATLSLRPPPSFPPARPAAEISSRGNYADPSRGSSPRPRSPPPPLRWGAGARPRRRGGAGSLGREVAGGRGDVGYRLVLPCDAALRPVIPRAPRARARALSRGTSCCCPATGAHPPPRNPRSILASAGRWSLPGSSCVSSAAPSWSAPERSRRSPTSPKVLDECQNQRACHLLVNSRVFGPDLCPGSSKYLLVSFKCQPNELKNKTVCEDHELKLHCHESKFLNIYSATYGRRTQERDVCSSEAGWLPPFDCLSYSALHVLSRRCYGKQRCKILVNNHHFGSPCLPGVKKYLSVFYACGVGLDPREPRILRKDGVIVSHSLAAFAYIRAHPERAALLFVSSVCIGLALTLCALVIRGSCTKDLQELQLAREHLVPGSDEAEEDSQDEEGEEDSSDSDFPGELSGFCRTTYPVYSSIEAAELAERIERREQIIQEIWMNSGLDTSLPRNMGQFY
ncbi:protein eva-1 homolog C isoform X2 [Odocoileus virginianus]|uniref:Protein eva-1 homolog C isoform X2 n=1 Tax=Odocoileus virginianus TaxID=9874 RepID=A0ABM4H6Q2_ODOVR